MFQIRNTIYILTALFVATPFFAVAQIRDFESGLDFFSIALDRILPILILIALLFFVYSVVAFVWKSRGSGEVAGEKQKIIWGIIGLFVILSIWGIIGVVSRTLGTGTGGVFQDVSVIDIDTESLV